VEVLEGTRESVITHFMQQLDKNINKKEIKITDNMFSDIYSESIELQMLNHRYEWKINFRTFVKTRAEGSSVSKKYEGYEAEVDDKMPRLTMVLTTFMASSTFQKDLYKLLKESSGSFHMDVGELFKQTIAFSDKLMRMKQNGYLGYEYKIEQNMKDEPTLDAAAKAENDKGIDDLYEVIFSYEIKHLDW
jgi:hypothetical protein